MGLTQLIVQLPMKLPTNLLVSTTIFFLKQPLPTILLTTSNYSFDPLPDILLHIDYGALYPLYFGVLSDTG